MLNISTNLHAKCALIDIENSKSKNELLCISIIFTSESFCFTLKSSTQLTDVQIIIYRKTPYILF